MQQTINTQKTTNQQVVHSANTSGTSLNTVGTSLNLPQGGQYVYTQTTQPYTITPWCIDDHSTSIEDVFVKKNPEVYYKHTKASDEDVAQALNHTMDKLIFDEVCKVYNLLTWNDIDNKYIATITIKSIPLAIVVNYDKVRFQVLNNNEIIIDSWFTKLEDLINDIRQTFTIITKKDILEKLRAVGK